jgi:hypothetical protein
LAKDIGTSELMDVWASDGAVVQPSLDKKENGWELGEQPPHEYMNWILNILGKSLNHIFQNGVPLWNSTTAYVVGNLVQVSGVIYRAKADNNNSAPPNNNWLAIAPLASKNSIQFNDGAFQLVGDTENPGNNKLYGTNGDGERVWKDAPSQADGFVTGDLKWRYDNAALSGYVRLNGKSIGKDASAATERANDDTLPLYTHLWSVDPNLVVSGGRGASASADFAAGKVINLPDAKNRAFFALDGMGGTDTVRIANGNVLGTSGGAETHTLIIDEIPAHSHSLPSGYGDSAALGVSGTATQPVKQSGSVGGGNSHNNMPPFIVGGTVYMKL